MKKQDVKQEVIWTGIDEICEKMGRKSIVSILNFRRDLDCPLKKDGGVWVAVESEVLAWAADLGIDNIRDIDHSKAFRLVARRRRSGPGEVLRGDVNSLCERLRVSTNALFVAQGHDNNPFKKLEGNRYEIDLNRWQDYLEDTAFRGDR
jgi:hypothetical protein